MSSKRRIRKQSCDGKKQYETQEKAQNSLFRQKRQNILTGWFNVYKCKFCKKFHLGHNKKIKLHF